MEVAVLVVAGSFLAACFMISHLVILPALKRRGTRGASDKTTPPPIAGSSKPASRKLSIGGILKFVGIRVGPHGHLVYGEVVSGQAGGRYVFVRLPADGRVVRRKRRRVVPTA